MSRWDSLATWVGPTPNKGGLMRKRRGLVMHIAQGSYDGTIAWQRNPDSETSSHFIVSHAGSIAQMVDTARVAWCQGEGNLEWLSVEFAGWAAQGLTDAQVSAAAKLLAETHKRYGVPIETTNRPDGRGLGWHGMGGAAWGGHPDCPGPAVLRRRPEIISAAKRLVRPPSPYRRVVVARTPAWRSTVSGIAEHYGYRWRVVWEDTRNTALRNLRRRPEMIQPGDVIYVRRKG